MQAVRERCGAILHWRSAVRHSYVAEEISSPFRQNLITIDRHHVFVVGMEPCARRVANVGCIVAETQLGATMTCHAEQTVFRVSVLMIRQLHYDLGRRTHLGINHVWSDIQCLSELDELIELVCSRSSAIRIVVDAEPLEMESKDGRGFLYPEAFGRHSFGLTADGYRVSTRSLCEASTLNSLFAVVLVIPF